VLRPPKDDKGDQAAEDERTSRLCGKATTADTAALADTPKGASSLSPAGQLLAALFVGYLWHF